MKNTYKKFFIVILSVLLIFSAVIPAFATEINEDLPHITRWVNGKAAGEDGAFLYDTWAVDDTNISEAKFVLVNQEGIEAMRVKNYPEDIESDKKVKINAYEVEITVNPPKDVESEIILTIENKNALYYVNFNKENAYKTTTAILPGEYLVTYVDVVTDNGSEYRLKEDTKLVVKDKAVKSKLDIVRITTDAEKVEKEVQNLEEGSTGVRNFDSNGDLLSDTVRLFIFMVLLFGVYLYIKRRREKEQEIHK